MNKSYIQDDDNVTIYTDGGVRIKDYTDNIGEILVQENLVEELENRTNGFKKLLKSLKRYKRVCKYVLPISIPIVFGLIFEVITKFDISSFLGLSVYIPVVLIGEIVMLYPELKRINQRKNAVNKTLDYLEQNLNSEKEKLNQLNSNANVIKTKKTNILRLYDITSEELENEEDFEKILESKKIYVNDVEILKNLRKKISFNYKLGYNEEIYHKYYELGILNEKLQSEFTQEEIEQIKEYFENEIIENKSQKNVKKKCKIRV